MNEMQLCRACKSPRLYMFLQLGSHPPANQFLSADELSAPEPSFPLNCHVCLDCALIQVPNHITSGFFRHYLYVPSASATMRGHFAKAAAALAARYLKHPDDLIVDIGSNDGLFLAACKQVSARALGVEPAANLTEIALSRGVEVVNDYFTPESAARIRERYGPAKVIVTTNTFNHIDDLYSFMQGIDTLLGENSAFVIEVPHSLDLVRNNEFDTIYHEHLSEFSVKSVVDLFAEFDMVLCDVERLEIHGGSMRLHGQRRRAGAHVSPAVEQWLARERQALLFSEQTYDDFRQRVERNREALLELLGSLKRQGKRLAGYGAPAKGNTLLNYCGIGADLLEFLGDRNPLKQGLYSPGMHVPIVESEAILREQPDYVLVLAWNFANEIIEQQDEYRRRGGRFILPIPEPVVVQ